MEIVFLFMLVLITVFTILSLFIIFIEGIPYIKEAFLSEEIQFSIKMSVGTATVSTGIVMFFAVPSGYILERREFFGKKLLGTILEIPLSLPYLVIGICLLTLFASDFGKTLRSMGFPVIFHRNGIVVAQTFVNLPFAISMIRSTVREIDPRLEFVAKNLGASNWYAFYSIVLGITRRSLLSIGLICWSRALGEFGATLMLVGVTRMKTETLPGSIYLNISTGNNEIAMASAILLIIIALLVQLTSKYLTKNDTAMRRRG
ncbi:ABC transporter permease [Alkalibaculum bacchi]|uniref:ABC transporter permease n=1 Tax=Alkalibaculum bacchi TaxID=645887 RepID=UPI0026F062B8|nr:ABC transporter permease subunit [Alkalibaculum bacchi]